VPAWSCSPRTGNRAVPATRRGSSHLTLGISAIVKPWSRGCEAHIARALDGCDGRQPGTDNETLQQLRRISRRHCSGNTTQWKDWSADFTHVYWAVFLRKQVVERGRLFVKKPGTLRGNTPRRKRSCSSPTGQDVLIHPARQTVDRQFGSIIFTRASSSRRWPRSNDRPATRDVKEPSRLAWMWRRPKRFGPGTWRQTVRSDWHGTSMGPIDV
jgi:hypothetical protein